VQPFIKALHHFPLVREVQLPNPTFFGSPHLSLFLGLVHTRHYFMIYLSVYMIFRTGVIKLVASSHGILAWMV
jgi:hypothetical protein